MIHERYNELLRKLELPYRPVAIKMCFEKPEVPRYDGPACAFCQFVKYAQDTGKSFYMNIPVAGYRQSGEMETVVPAFWKPFFRYIGNRYSARACSGC